MDLHAPGVDVISAVNSSDTATKRKTGTSMATPHVAGVLALYLEEYPVRALARQACRPRDACAHTCAEP